MTYKLKVQYKIGGQEWKDSSLGSGFNYPEDAKEAVEKICNRRLTWIPTPQGWETALNGVSYRVIPLGMIPEERREYWIGTDEERQSLRKKAVKLYTEQNKSPRAIAENLKISRGFVRQLLDEEGVERRTNIPTDEERQSLREKAVELYTEQNKSLRAIAEDLKISHAFVRQLLAEEGVERRTRRR